MKKLLFLFLVLCMPLVFADISLPAIGDGSHYQLQREKKIGRQFYHRLLKANKVVSDPMVDYYIKEVLSILLQNLDKNNRSFKVSIINDAAINAFAVPGGYIGINYGLVLSAQSEAQLAGVLSHEISHIVLNHLSQFLEKQNTTNTALVTSLLLALVLSQSLDAENKGEAVEALVLGSSAGAQQALINFTRENEYEADRKGLELMKKSGYPAIGMAEFFSILEDETGSGGLASIEYLRTHPISSNRMGEAYQFKSGKSVNNKDDSIEYELFKVYLNSLVGGGYKSLSHHVDVLQFEKALKQVRLNQYELAIKNLQSINIKDGANLWVINELIKIYTQQNEFEKALALIDSSLMIYPQQNLLRTQKVNILVLQKSFSDALILSLKVLDENEDNQSVRFNLVGIYEHLNRPLKAREIEGDFMFKKGGLVRAKYLYQLVLNATKDIRVKQELREKIEEIESLEKKDKN